MENRKIKGKQLNNTEILNLKEGMQVWLEDNEYTVQGMIVIVAKNSFSDNGLSLSTFSGNCKWYVPNCVSTDRKGSRYGIKVFQLVDEIKTITAPKLEAEIIGIKSLQGVKGEIIEKKDDSAIIKIDGVPLLFSLEFIKVLNPINIHKDEKYLDNIRGEDVHIVICKNRTMVTLFTSPKNISGMTKCHLEDKFDKEFAIDLAYWRAKEQHAMTLLNKSRENIGKLIKTKS